MYCHLLGRGLGVAVHVRALFLAEPGVGIVVGHQHPNLVGTASEQTLASVNKEYYTFTPQRWPLATRLHTQCALAGQAQHFEKNVHPSRHGQRTHTTQNICEEGEKWCTPHKAAMDSPSVHTPLRCWRKNPNGLLDQIHPLNRFPPSFFNRCSAGHRRFSEQTINIGNSESNWLPIIGVR